MKKYSEKICPWCFKKFVPTAPPQKFCGTYLKMEGCSYLNDLKLHRERMRIVNRKKALIGRRCGICRHLLMLQKPGMQCQFGDGKKCLCVRPKKHYNDGVRSPSAKLTADQVLRIRSLAGEKTRVAIAREFSIAASIVSQIISRKRWNSIP